MWIDRTICGEQVPPFDLDDDVLVRWGIHTSPHRSTLGMRGILRRLRYQVRCRTLAPPPKPPAVAAPAA
jgi:hypothetical protein